MRPFAKYYDLIYSDKNYEKDVSIFLDLVGLHRRPSILEIGCGTGNQSLLLSQKADVTAVEMDKDFADILRGKLNNNPVLPIQLFEGDIAGLSHNNFDAAAAFFHVVNYIDRQESLDHLFLHIAKRLKSGAVFLFDMWQGERAMVDPPRPETRIKETAGGKVTQAITPSLDESTRNVSLNYRISVECLGQAPEQFSEKITLHLWYRDEIIQSLTKAGFSDITFFDGRNYPAPATTTSWALWVTARKP